MNKPPKVFHPILFAILPVVFLYSQNIGEVFASQTLLPLALCLAGAILLWCIFALICKNKVKSALLTSIALVSFFFYGHVFSFVKDAYIGSWKVGLHSYFLPIWAMIFLAVMIVVFHTKKQLFNLTIILQAVAVCFIVMSLANIGLVYSRILLHKQADTSGQTSVVFESEDIIPGKIIARPNIYYIILDAHVRKDITQKYFDHDSSPFITALQDRGFFVGSKSNSNYNVTNKSLPSSLNFQYLEINPADPNHDSPESKMYLRSMYLENRLFKFLRKQGYSLVTFSTGFLSEFEHADVILSGEYTSNAFTNELINCTPLIAVEKYFLTRYSQHYKNLKSILEHLPKIAKYDSPHIAYAHILCPHPPFVFNEDGSYRSSGDAFRWDDANPNIPNRKSDYLNQLKYIDKRIIEVIDGILANSKEDPIIIIQGDHGIRWWIGSDTPEIEYAILNALHLPGYDYSQLNNEITPVNTFRYILNHYFSTEFEILDNRTFIKGEQIDTGF